MTKAENFNHQTSAIGALNFLLEFVCLFYLEDYRVSGRHLSSVGRAAVL
jgi:hypothetical protein